MKKLKEHLDNTLNGNEESIIFLNRLMKKGKYINYIYNFYKNSKNVKANMFLLIMTIQGILIKDENKIYEYCLKGAEGNDAVLQQYLAFCYFKGYGTIKNIEESKKIYKESMKKGNLNSAYDLGLIYLMENNFKYVKIFKINANKNHLESILVMIYLCYKGIDTKEDIYKWSKKYETLLIKKECEENKLEFVKFGNDYNSVLDKSYLKHIDAYTSMMLSLIEKNFLIDKEKSVNKVINDENVKFFFSLLDNIHKSIYDLINYF